MSKNNSSQLVNSLIALWTMMLPCQRKSFVGMFFLILFGTCLEALGLGLIFPVLAIISGENLIAEKVYEYLDKFSLVKLDSNDLLFYGLACLFLVFLIRTIFLGVVSYIQSKYSFAFRSVIAQNLFRQYLEMPFSFHLKTNSADLLHTLFSKTSAVSSLNQQVLMVLSELMNILILGLMLVMIQPVGALSVILVLIFAGWIFVYYTRNLLTKWAYDLERVDVQRLKIVQEGLGGIKDIKLLGREKQFFDRFKESDEESCRVNYLQATLQSLPRLWLEFLAFGSICLFIYINLFFNDSVELILPTLGIFAAAAFRIMPSVNRILAGLGNIGFTLPVVKKLMIEYVPIANLNSKLIHSVFSQKSVKQETSIQFVNVGYRYENSNSLAVKNLNFQIKIGSCVGFIGESGAGKTTLINLLLGLHAPTTGEILFDGKNISRHFFSWRELIGFVPQDIYLCDDSLRLNIAFGLNESEVDDDLVLKAIRDSQLDRFVSTLPDGLNTNVGERGVRISGGQKQRIGIARALYKNPPILVFDEATSALDNHTEAYVMEAVNSMRKNKTLIIIAHRLSTVANCDYVYKMIDGEIVNHGTPFELGLIT
jgi:ABC-type multidrug transport system fused ATPase/permease subunit